MAGALTFDLASTLCGWCAGDGRGVPMAGCIRLPPCDADLGLLACSLEDRIERLDAEFDPDFIGYESPLLMRHDRLIDLRRIYGLGMLTERFAVRKAQRTGRSIIAGECDPKRAKAALTGDAYASKSDMVKAARRLGVSLPATIGEGQQDAAMKRGEEWDDAPRDYDPYYRWLEPRLKPGRWAVIPDRPGAPSQINDSLLGGWPFGRTYGVPLWHMDGPLQRLGKLCEQYDMVALGWIGHPKKEPVGCPRYRARMKEVAEVLGKDWPPIHMMRGIAVAWDYQFTSADATSLAQNGHRYDSPIDTLCGDKWRGRRAYADKLERRRSAYREPDRSGRESNGSALRFDFE